MPSREMSVQTTWLRPAGPNGSRRSSIRMGTSDSQPRTAMRPLRMSAPSTIRSGPKRSSHSRKRSGFTAATVPTTAWVAPASKTVTRSARVAMPPPHSSSTSTRERMRSSTERFAGAACFAPSRSTRWMRRMPQSAKRAATSAGSSSYSFLLSKSPLERRTHFPPMRSMAGISSIMGYSFRKLLRICSPVSPLFSGWNWVP